MLGKSTVFFGFLSLVSNTNLKFSMVSRVLAHESAIPTTHQPQPTPTGGGEGDIPTPTPTGGRGDHHGWVMTTGRVGGGPSAPRAYIHVHKHIHLSLSLAVYIYIYIYV